MGEPRLNFFTRIYYSIAGFSNYRYFLRQSTGKAVVYLLLLAFIIGIIGNITFLSVFDTLVDDFSSSFEASVPEFTFSNGRLEMEGKMPVVLDDGQSVIIFDTSDSPNESILNNYDAAIMFTRDKLIQKNYVNRRVTDLSALQGITLTKDDFKRSLPMMKPFGKVMFVLLILFFVCGKFISALLISLIGSVINSSKRTNLSFQSIFKISVFSMTLPLIVCTVLDFLLRGVFLGVPVITLLFYVLAAVYVHGAISAIRKELDKFYDQLT